MTTWLDFRAEPIVDVPSITMKGKDGAIVLVCDAIDCQWEEVAESPDQIAEHQKWHEEGMPA